MTTETEHKHDDHEAEAPAWFGPAVVRAMKNDFLAHIKVCAKCRAAKEVDEVCPEGADYVKALKMDQRVEPEKPAVVVTKNEKARAAALKSARNKRDLLQKQIGTIEQQIDDLLTERDGKAFDIEVTIETLTKEADEARAMTNRLTERIADKEGLISKMKDQIKKAEAEIVDLGKRCDSLLDQVSTAEEDRADSQNRLDAVKHLNEPKVIQLKKEKEKLEGRLRSHFARYPEIENDEPVLRIET